MLYQTLQGGGIWQEMEPVGSIQRNFCGQCRKSLLSKNPLQRIQMRPMRSFANWDSYAGESADDIYAVAGQLRKSSGAIITMLGNYERVLKELAGVYEDTEKTVSRNAGRLKFGGMR